ncbi:MAG: hypothetical protein QGH60_16030 [Phycisphaerae bacterium]|jgi:hypothetical protein|nr:hypothetical protein [Phycisphaerae bacterium]
MNRILSISLLCTVLVFFGSGRLHAAGPPAKTIGTITDKTLVAWVRLANTKQRGSGAVTLIDTDERFDSIAFGETTPGKWMAGSDFFKRTEKQQGAYATENPDGKAFVQMAISYRGNEVTIYRNAKQYARYKISAPQSFKDGCKVLIGLRYIGGQGETGFLAGDLDDVRIYATALTGKQLAALKPNIDEGHKSLAKPVAWWTFEDGSTAYGNKLFGDAKLVGNAKIAGGKLVLDGKGSYLVVSQPPPPFKPEIQSIFYKARHRDTGNMWDTWLYLHDGTYYLYYLANKGRRWDNISMATSKDGVHWLEVGQVLYKGPGVTWMGTGSTWKSPNFKKDGKFFMNFSEWKGPRQTISFAESTDLLHWKRLADDLEFKQDERWYKPKGRWDCIWTIARPGGGLYGYWTATPKPETGGRFGFGETLDGIRWKALKAPKTTGVGGGEVGAIEKIGGKYYMMFGNHGRMVTLLADKPQGPFHAAKKNFSFLAGHTYFSRMLRTPGGVLGNHHSIARNRQVSFAPLKTMVIDKEGTMRLGWWKGNEKMKHKSIPVKLPANAKASGTAPVMLDTALDMKTGVILEGTLRLPADKSAPRRGLYIEYGKDKGSAILIDSAGLAELGPMGADGSGFRAEKKVNREMTFARPAKFRLLLKGVLLEFYLDDILIECFSLPGAATGRIGLIRGSKSDSITDLKAWR